MPNHSMGLRVVSITRSFAWAAGFGIAGGLISAAGVLGGLVAFYVFNTVHQAIYTGPEVYTVMVCLLRAYRGCWPSQAV